MTTKRRAVVEQVYGRGGWRPRLEEVAAYLPGNYTVRPAPAGGHLIIEGTDSAGWTLDGYVIPRLISGLIFAREVAAEPEEAGPKRVDPPGCGCTDCLTGYSIPLDRADAKTVKRLVEGKLRNSTSTPLVMQTTVSASQSLSWTIETREVRGA